MGKVEKIEQDVSQLSHAELDIFRAWFQAFDAHNWDQQIARDAQSGKLDALAANALKQFQTGNATEF